MLSSGHGGGATRSGRWRTTLHGSPRGQVRRRVIHSCLESLSFTMVGGGFGTRLGRSRWAVATNCVALVLFGSLRTARRLGHRVRSCGLPFILHFSLYYFGRRDEDKVETHSIGLPAKVNCSLLLSSPHFISFLLQLVVRVVCRPILVVFTVAERPFSFVDGDLARQDISESGVVQIT